jgi:hypothetical protein
MLEQSKEMATKGIEARRGGKLVPHLQLNPSKPSLSDMKSQSLIELEVKDIKLLEEVYEEISKEICIQKEQIDVS